MKQWEATINRLIKEAAQRRATERNGVNRIVTVSSATPFSQSRMNPSPHPSSAHVYSHMSQSSTSQSSTSTISVRNRQTGNQSAYDSSYSSGMQGYPPHDGFDPDNDDDDSEDMGSALPYGSVSGRTPLSRRGPNALSLPPEREANPVSERPRAQTEGGDGPVIAQWRSNGLPPVPNPMQSPALRPLTPRLNPNLSANSYGSDASFGSAIPPKSGRPPLLRNQYSSSRLRNGYDSPSGSQGPSFAGNDYRNGRSATPTLIAPSMSRSRSASQPQPYVPPGQPKAGPPPMPSTSAQPHWSRDRQDVPTEVNGKRGSGSSQSTGDSSDYSPNTSSPITPFGSSDSSLGGVNMGMPNSRMQSYDHPKNPVHHEPSSPPVKVKVHFHEDIFVIQVPRLTEYSDLVEKVGRKIRLCGPRRDDGPLRVKYRDEDGDMVCLGSTEDVQMAFEQYRPGGQVTLFVT